MMICSSIIIEMEDAHEIFVGIGLDQMEDSSFDG